MSPAQSNLRLEVFPGELHSCVERGNLSQAHATCANDKRCLQLLEIKQDKLKCLQDEAASLELEIVALLNLMNNRPQSNGMNLKKPRDEGTVWGVPSVGNRVTDVTHNSLQAWPLPSMSPDPCNLAQSPGSHQQHMVLVKSTDYKQSLSCVMQSSDGNHYQRNVWRDLYEPVSCSNSCNVDTTEPLRKQCYSHSHNPASSQTDEGDSSQGDSRGIITTHVMDSQVVE